MCVVHDLPEHVARNRAAWDPWAPEYEEPGRRDWSSDEPRWGVWGVPEAQVGVLPADVGEMIALLRGCGFEVEELIEIRPPDGSTTRFPLVTLEWAQKWPCEEVWRPRRAR